MLDFAAEIVRQQIENSHKVSISLPLYWPMSHHITLCPPLVYFFPFLLCHITLHQPLATYQNQWKMFSSKNLSIYTPHSLYPLHPIPTTQNNMFSLQYTIPLWTWTFLDIPLFIFIAHNPLQISFKDRVPVFQPQVLNLPAYHSFWCSVIQHHEIQKYRFLFSS